jgi:O-antigen ligase
MIRSDNAAIIFLCGILISSLALSPFALDQALSPRFLLLALTILIILVIWYRKWTVLAANVDAVSIALIAYVLSSLLSSCQAINYSEAIFENGRVLLYTATYFLASYFLVSHGESFAAKLRLISLITFGAGFAWFFWQFVEAPQLDKSATYLFTSLNAHKNLYASFIFLLLPFLLISATQDAGTIKTLSSIAIFIGLIILIALRTKAVWIGLATGIVFYFSVLAVQHWFRRPKSVWIAVIISVICSVVFFSILLPRFVNGALSGNSYLGISRSVDEERLQLWDKTYHMVSKSPLTGIGAGNWQVHFPDAGLSGIWRAEDLNVTFQRPHNDFLWILSENGYVGLCIFLAFLFLLIFLGLKSFALSHDRQEKQRIRILLSAVTGYAVISFFDFPKERIEHLAWSAILFATLKWQTTGAANTKPIKAITLQPVVLLLLIPVSCLLVIIGYKRHNGEFNTARMYDAKREGNAAKAMRSSLQAESVFYTLDPTSVPLPWYRGNLLAEANDTLRTLAEFRMAYKFHPFNRNVINDLASALVIRGKSDSAKWYYKEASRISPRFDDPKLNLAALYIRENNFPAADTVLRSIMHDSERRTQYQKIVGLMLGR